MQTDIEIGSNFKSQLNVIISKFKLNKEALQKEFMSKENKKDRITFFKNYSERERQIIKEEYFKTLEILQEHIPFFRWFNQRKEFDYLCTVREKEIWKTACRGEVKYDNPHMKGV